MRAFSVCWPDGRTGLVLCQSPLHVYNILEAETDITQCTVHEETDDMCVIFDTQTGIYSEQKPKPYTEIDPPSSLDDDLYKMHLSGEFCDVELKVEGECIPCHKAVLYARSSYFRSMFTTSLKESSQSKVEINGFPFALLDGVVKFMYTSKLNLPRDNTNTDLQTDVEKDLSALNEYLKAADFFDVPSLTAYIERQILKTCEYRRPSASYIKPLVEIYQTAESRNFQNLEKVVAACVPLDETDCADALHTMDLPKSLQENLTATFLKKYQTQFFFGANHKLHTLLQSGDLSRESILADIGQLESEGADAIAIMAGHTLVNRACRKNLFGPDLSESIWQLITYFLEQRSYPIDYFDHNGRSMLHIAAVDRQEDLVTRLLQAGASPDGTDNKGLSIIEDVKVNCDSEIASYICQDILLNMDYEREREGNPRLVEHMMEIYKDLWVKSHNILCLLSENKPPGLWFNSFFRYFRESELRPVLGYREVDLLMMERKRKTKCLKALGITLNEEFISEAASKYVSKLSPASLLNDGLGPMYTSGPFSREFRNSIMHSRFPNFMRCMSEEDDKRITAVNSAKEYIRKCLIKDITDERLHRRMKLCSMGQLRQFGVFDKFSVSSWIVTSDALSILASTYE